MYLHVTAQWVGARKQRLKVHLPEKNESDICSRWVHRESNLMFTMSSNKDRRKNSLSFLVSVNRPSGPATVNICVCVFLWSLPSNSWKCKRYMWAPTLVIEPIHYADVACEQGFKSTPCLRVGVEATAEGVGAAPHLHRRAVSHDRRAGHCRLERDPPQNRVRFQPLGPRLPWP